MDDSGSMTFGARLRHARLEAGLSQADLGGEEFTVSYVSHLEAGRRDPSPRVISVFERRLALPRGYLAGGDWGRGPQDAGDDVGTSDLAALASRVVRSRFAASPADQAEVARETAELALRQDRPEVWWGMSLLQITALKTAGRYADAAAAAESLSRHPWVQSHPALAAEAHTVASRTHRRALDLAAATHHAHAALAASGDGVDAALRAEAIIAALATRRLPAAPLVLELETLHHRLAGTHLGGLVAWTLGNESFNDGDLQEGLRWHEVAATEVNPELDHRQWSRFVSATILQRVRHGIDDGLAELLPEARHHLGRLASSFELAELATTEVRWHLQAGRLDEASAALDAAFALPEVPEAPLGRLHLERARLRQQRGDRAGAEADAVAAARLLTLAGDGEGSREAWTLHDTITTGS
ncbi:helix-turn-helix domain-containing protein [Arsenicicoccus dermatophilus]|uniref:helix-turn-helix domain-containing protein n=2 Tax=Arsenicicoccus dermatophilus TaxID=1076331 RepID=UPI0039175F78